MTTPVLPDFCLTTYEAALAELGLDDTLPNKVKLAPIIKAVSTRFARYCGRDFHYNDNIIARVKGFGTHVIYLDRPPIKEITKIEIDDLVHTAIEVDSDIYFIESSDAGKIRCNESFPWTARERHGIEPMKVAGTERPLIKVTYKGGWVTPIQDDGVLIRDMPDDLERYALDAIVTVYAGIGRDRQAVRVQTSRASITYRDAMLAERGMLAGFLPIHIAQGLLEYRL